MKNFTNKYQLSKTLRFELKPQGKTLSYIQEHGLLKDDEHRAESYILVKAIIDEYHKYYIDDVLSNFKLRYENNGRNDSLSEFYLYYNIREKSDMEKNKFELVKTNLRKQIASKLTKDDRYKRIGKKELIREDLVNFVNGDVYRLTYKRNDKYKDYSEDQLDELRQKDLDLINEFSDFTTYFSGFHENRKNMYSDEDKSTAIAYRLINENLPRFIDNMNIFSKLADTIIADHFEELYKNLEEYLNVDSIEELFQLNYYSNLLTQRQIDVYNAVIGGKSYENGDRIQGLNEYLSVLYNSKQKDKHLRLKFKPLYKQILSDRNAISFLPEEFESSANLLEAVEQCYEELLDRVFARDEISLITLLSDIKNYDTRGIYISNDLQLTDISQKMFGSWDVIQRAIEYDYEREHPRKKESAERYEENKKKAFKANKIFSVYYINKCLDAIDVSEKIHIEDYFTAMGTLHSSIENSNLFTIISNAYEGVKDLLKSSYPEGRDLAQDKTEVEKIKKMLDSIKDIQRFIKPLLGGVDEGDKDNKFYAEFSSMWDVLDKTITPLYNKVRSYVTRKPYSKNKIRLYFENNGSFLNGWVDSQTEKSDNGTQYGGYLLRAKNGIGEYDYFLGVSSDSKLLRNKNNIQKYTYERLNYYQPKSATVYDKSYIGTELVDGRRTTYSGDKKALINAILSVAKDSKCPTKDNVLIFLKDLIVTTKNITPSFLINKLKDNYPNFYSELLRSTIYSIENDRITSNLHKTILSLDRIPGSVDYKNVFFANFIEAQSAIENLCKEKIYEYFPIADEDIQVVMNRQNKPLLLFKITNKDLSYAETFLEGKRNSRGMDNLHTMYFKALMEGSQSTIDIGTGQIFYREHSINYSDDKLKIGHHHELLKDKFSYPIISNKRYAYDKFQFHLSINLNYKYPKKVNINDSVKAYLRDNADSTYIIGIDRGERHLLYLSLIDPQGKLIKQRSLNEIVNEYKKTNYKDLLVERGDERDKARKNWNTIESIKELKEGYLSQVVHEITQLMVKYNAIVVLEDLNRGFKRERQKIEHQVYQKFEKMLIDKLNYLVDKRVAPNEPCGIFNALQLANELTKVKNSQFKNMSGQNGFLFYIPAWNTSKIDPVTGFVNLFDTRYSNTEKAKLFFSKFDRIAYNSDKGWFEFKFDYDKFTTKAEGSRIPWTLCTWGQRIKSYRNPEQNNNWDSKEVDLSEEFKIFFANHDIPINDNLKESILNQQSKEFYEGLLSLLHLTLQMRNSHINSEVDYIVSPVADKNGKFFDSRNKDGNLPENADANGAYNIARKGLWIIEQIKQTNDLKKLKLAISNKEWLQYAQRNNE